jgi:hypothetical protein
VDEIIYWTEALNIVDAQMRPLVAKLNTRKGLSFDEQSELKILTTMNGMHLNRLCEAIRTKNNEPKPRKKLFRRN